MYCRKWKRKELKLIEWTCYIKKSGGGGEGGLLFEQLNTQCKYSRNSLKCHELRQNDMNCTEMHSIAIQRNSAQFSAIHVILVIYLDFCIEFSSTASHWIGSHFHRVIQIWAEPKRTPHSETVTNWKSRCVAYLQSNIINEYGDGEEIGLRIRTQRFWVGHLYANELLRYFSLFGDNIYIPPCGDERSFPPHLPSNAPYERGYASKISYQCIKDLKPTSSGRFRTSHIL